MATTTMLPVADFLNESWSLTGSGVTNLFNAWNNDDDTKYASCPTYKGRACVSFAQDTNPVPAGAVVTSVTVYLRVSATDSLFRSITVNCLASDNTALFTTRTIYPTTSPVTYEVGTYQVDPCNYAWDLHRINKILCQVFSYNFLAVIRCFKFYCVINYKTAPTLSVTAPTGTVLTPSPTITWTYSQTDGDPQASATYKIFTSAVATGAGFNADYSSAVYTGTVTGTTNSFTLPTSLTSGSYYVYVKARSIYGATSTWYSSSFTVQGPVPGTPSVGVAGDSAHSAIILTLQDTSNIASAQEADFEISTTTDPISYLPTTNCAIAQDATTFYNVGADSLKLTASSAADMAVTFPLTSVQGGSAMTFRIQAKAAATGRSNRMTITWYNANSSYATVGSSTVSNGTDTTGSWTENTVNVTAPSTATHYTVEYRVLSPANAEVHNIDHYGVMYGTSQAWTDGDFMSRNVLSGAYSAAPGTASWTNGANTTTSNITNENQATTGARGLNALRITASGNGSVLATMTTKQDVSKISSDVFTQSNNTMTVIAHTLGSFSGTPYITVNFYRGTGLLASPIVQGTAFTNSAWSKSVAQFTIPSGTTSFTVAFSASGLTTGQTIDVQAISAGFGTSPWYRPGTGRTTSGVWTVPVITYSDDGGTTYQNIPGISFNPPIYDQVSGSLIYTDHTIVPGIARQYKVYTYSYGENGDGFSSSTVTTGGTTVIPNAGAWWLKDIQNSANNLQITPFNEQVTTDTTNTSTVFQPLGSNYPVVISEGFKADSIKLKMVMHQADWLKFKTLMGLGRTLYLQSDVDQAWWVRPSDNYSASTIVSATRQTDPVRMVTVTFTQVAPVA